jgi:hypothetical protein
MSWHEPRQGGYSGEQVQLLQPAVYGQHDGTHGTDSDFIFKKILEGSYVRCTVYQGLLYTSVMSLAIETSNRKTSPRKALQAVRLKSRQDRALLVFNKMSIVA